MKPIVRIGLVGCGRVAERGWLPAIRSVAAARLVSVADVDTDRCRAIAPGAAAYASCEELVAAGGVDAVIVATPAASHLDDAWAAAASALPSLVEKPPAPDALQARLLAGITPVPWIGFNRRFEPALQLMRERLPDDGQLHLKLTFHYRRTSWKPRVVADEALLDVGPHLVDLARWITRSEIRHLRTPLLEPHHCDLELELDRGRTSLSCRSNRPYYEGITVRDAKGSLLGGESRGGLARTLMARLGRSSEEPLVESMAAQLVSFCAAVRGENSGSLATALDGLAVMEAVEAARCSAAHGGEWIDLPRLGPD